MLKIVDWLRRVRLLVAQGTRRGGDDGGIHGHLAATRSGKQPDRLIDGSVKADAQQDTAAVSAAVCQLNPDVIPVDANARDVQAPFVKSHLNRPLVERSEPPIN